MPPLPIPESELAIEQGKYLASRSGEELVGAVSRTGAPSTLRQGMQGELVRRQIAAVQDLTASIDRYADSSGKQAQALNQLTVVLVILTKVLVALTVLLLVIGALQLWVSWK